MQNDGGPIFPVTEEQEQNGWDGMSLRDYFAAKAMQGLYACSQTGELTLEQIAATAYEAADAMLKARHGQ